MFSLPFSSFDVAFNIAVFISSFLRATSEVFWPMSQYHVHFYGDGPSGRPKQGLVVTTTPPAADARLVRSVSHLPPRAPLPLRNVSPRPASVPSGRVSRECSADRHRSPRRERSQRHHHRSRSRRRQRQLKCQLLEPHLARQVYKPALRYHGRLRLLQVFYNLYNRDYLDLVPL